MEFWWGRRQGRYSKEARWHMYHDVQQHDTCTMMSIHLANPTSHGTQGGHLPFHFRSMAKVGDHLPLLRNEWILQWVEAYVRDYVYRAQGSTCFVLNIQWVWLTLTVVTSSVLSWDCILHLCGDPSFTAEGRPWVPAALHTSREKMLSSVCKKAPTIS